MTRPIARESSSSPLQRPGEGQPLISIDVVPLVLDRGSERLVVVTGERIFDPHIGEPALPGVLLAHERVDDAARRALSTKVGVGPKHLTYLGDLGVFDNPDRDPRGPTLSISKIAALAIVPDVEGVHPLALSRFNPVPAALDDQVAHDGPLLPFDHDRIVRAAAENASMRIWTDPAFALGLLGPTFSTRDLLLVLRDLAAAVDAPAPDPGNAQRRLRATGWVRETGRTSRHASVGRPSLVWRWA